MKTSYYQVQALHPRWGANLSPTHNNFKYSKLSDAILQYRNLVTRNPSETYRIVKIITKTIVIKGI